MLRILAVFLSLSLTFHPIAHAVAELEVRESISISPSDVLLLEQAVPQPLTAFRHALAAHPTLGRLYRSFERDSALTSSVNFLESGRHHRCRGGGVRDSRAPLFP